VDTAVHPLSREDCWALLRSSNVGRLAVAIHAQPFIFPVDFMVDHGCLVFRTDEGAKLDGAFRSNSVCFEVDGTDPEGETAWSVIVTGRCAAVLDPDRVAAIGLRSPSHWDSEAQPYLVEIHPEHVSGHILALARGVI
jgi:nitroimidazol reductase NimA-like FMN-containing flavoprotein (pyridoxamine 5'-phosphate oxidase superfamily)